jgi:hypothetical protein
LDFDLADMWHSEWSLVGLAVCFFPTEDFNVSKILSKLVS